MDVNDDLPDGSAAIGSMRSLSERLELTGQERAWHETDATLPVLISPYYFSLIDAADERDPIRRQVVPSVEELVSYTSESTDPLAEVSHSATARLIHRYASRAAFLVTDICATYCRHCFRRRFSGGSTGPASEAELEAAVQYVGSHTGIKELLFTGGDPLTLSDSNLERMIARFREVRPDLVIRICTRIPVTLPSRVTEALITMLGRYRSAPFYLFTQFNHPREITCQSSEAVARFIDAGIPAMNQTVLLKGVNDDADVLAALMERLVSIRVKPYYLFQGDLVGGTAHLRVPIEEGLLLEEELRRRLSGLAMPVYAVDLPQGGGKVPLGRHYMVGRDSRGAWMFKTVDGSIRTYDDPPVQLSKDSQA